MTLLRVTGFAVALFLSTTAGAADAPPLKASNGVLVNAAGMTVYTYDKDEAGSGKSFASPPVRRTGRP